MDGFIYTLIVALIGGLVWLSYNDPAKAIPLLTLLEKILFWLWLIVTLFLGGMFVSSLLLVNKIDDVFNVKIAGEGYNKALNSAKAFKDMLANWVLFSYVIAIISYVLIKGITLLANYFKDDQ